MISVSYANFSLWAVSNLLSRSFKFSQLQHCRRVLYMYGITSQLPVLFSWNAAITHLAQDVSFCPFLEPWATLQSVVLSVLDAALLPVSISSPSYVFFSLLLERRFTPVQTFQHLIFVIKRGGRKYHLTCVRILRKNQYYQADLQSTCRSACLPICYTLHSSRKGVLSCFVFQKQSLTNT